LQIKEEFTRFGIATDHGSIGLKREFVVPLARAGHLYRQA